MMLLLKWRFAPDSIMPSQESFYLKVVVCPACGGKSIYAESNRYRPFCSERCKGHDFGDWASERFRMPAQTQPDGAPTDDDSSKT